MILSIELRRKIADQIIRVVAPVVFFGMILIAVSVLALSGQQYRRLIPAGVALVLVIPSWVFAQKGKPMTGIVFLLICTCTAIITGMTMPKMTGDILSQKIHLKRPDIPVIMCTGFSEVMDENKAKALDIHAFLFKPVIAAKLLETIRKVLDAVVPKY